ncbi:unnamed protein product [Phaedon cochleariae]|uniref:C2H2-type domain-containing protein n=1 Tax=Phaedon cochleariae TaxID=80249 RepID=A0A9N9X3Q7_PHACE|nr:unnamed protein product [Phaedon cochleariae]
MANRKYFFRSGSVRKHLKNLPETLQYFCEKHKKFFNSTIEHSCKALKRCISCFEEVPSNSASHVCSYKHTKKYLKTCDFCGVAFAKQLFDDHLKLVHKLVERPRRCTKCKMKFPNLKEYYRHRYSKHRTKNRNRKKITVCYICGKNYSTNTLTQHIKTIHQKARSFGCEACGKAFATKYKRDRHMIVHTNELRYQCHVCSKMFKMPYSLQVHTKMHSRKEEFECIVCGKTFSTKQSRDNHLKTHGPG